jgi:uncharacterized protein
VTVAEALALVVAGAAAGFISTVVGLASLVSYPALLAIGLPPLSANMTNTVALLFTGVGAAAGSRPELAGQASRIRRLGPVAALGGATGAALLLITPGQTFQRIAPVLIGAASLTLLIPAGSGRSGGGGRGQPAAGGAQQEADPPGPSRSGLSWLGFSRPGRGGWLVAGVFGVTIYVGYFGAAAGIVMLAVLLATLAEPLARANALRNVIGALANSVAAIGFAVFGKVDWAAVAPLAAGFLVGGWTGPALVRRLPARLLRLIVALLGLAVAVKLALSAYS